jgi:uracil permease
MLLSCFVATTLIAQVCGVEVSGALVGAGLSTLTYALLTNFKSPMYISNSGAYVTPVIMALAVGGYTAVAIGGAVSAIVYTLFGLIFSKISVENIYKIFPKVLIGSITIVIGINLMSFIPGYIGDTQINLIVALFTVLVIALASHYLKGTLSLFPFLIGILAGYIISIPLGLVDFNSFYNTKFFVLPHFAFTKWTSIDFNVIPIIITYIAFSISCMMEVLSDHAALSNIIGIDLYREPGISKILIGEGIANIVSSSFGGLGATSYGEGIATIGFSKCASIYSTIGCAILMILLGFIGPVQAFIASIPSCVMGGGSAIILYSYIANSGIKQLQLVDFNNNKNLLISGIVLSVGISGIVLGGETFSLSGTALAVVLGIIFNLILKDKERI